MALESGPKWEGRLIWECKIGIDDIGKLPLGSDLPMRQAIGAMFYALTGKEADFCFSGWNSKLTDVEKEVVKKPWQK